MRGGGPLPPAASCSASDPGNGEGEAGTLPDSVGSAQDPLGQQREAGSLPSPSRPTGRPDVHVASSGGAQEHTAQTPDRRADGEGMGKEGDFLDMQ